MKIAEVSEKFGFTPDTLRYYERIGLIPPVTRNGGGIRGKGPSIAIRKGAIGFLMRSAGTDHHRAPHTGITRFDAGLTPVPSAALAMPDADQLARLLARCIACATISLPVPDSPRMSTVASVGPTA